MSTSTTYMTFEQFEQLPDEPNKLELIDGEVVRMPPPFTQHSRIACGSMKLSSKWFWRFEPRDRRAI